MKRTVGILTGVAALAVGVYLGGQSLAQSNNQYPAGTAAAAAPLQTRIAVVNIGQVFKNYQKCKTFQAEIKQQAQTMQQNIDGRRAQALAAQKEMENPQTPPARKEQLERDLRRLQREYQDATEEAKQQLAKHEFEQLVQTYKEIEEAVQVYARTYAIELVLQYADPDSQEKYLPAYFQQRLSNRACMPLYLDPRMDITANITAMLNQRMASSPARPPTGN